MYGSACQPCSSNSQSLGYHCDMEYRMPSALSLPDRLTWIGTWASYVHVKLNGLPRPDGLGQFNLQNGPCIPHS